MESYEFVVSRGLLQSGVCWDFAWGFYLSGLSYWDLWKLIVDL